ncbi:hypothetical protein L218DRAFT_909088, partial [Marasmius fiardii PR-910]
LTTLAAATAIPRADGDQCCQQTGTVTDPLISAVLTLLGINVSDVTALIGLNCVPITVIGSGNGACSGTAVSCTDNSHGTLIHLGCVPITI